MTILMSLFILKHFLADFPLQIPYMYKNKGTFGHPGGILHAGIHAGLTMLLLMWAMPWLTSMTVILISLAEGVIHYHIDWAKMNINKHYGWGPLTSEYFWWLLGADQLLHYMTYAVMVWGLLGGCK